MRNSCFFQKSFHSWLSNFVILAGVPMECQVSCLDPLGLVFNPRSQNKIPPRCTSQSLSVGWSCITINQSIPPLFPHVFVRAMVLFPSPPGSERVSWIFFLNILPQETERVPCLEKALKKCRGKEICTVIFANDFTLDHVPTCKFISVT